VRVGPTNIALEGERQRERERQTEKWSVENFVFAVEVA